MHDRETSWGLAEHQTFDVLIMGGGINGTCLFDRLTRQGYKVILVDENDFGSGTSQASGMMVWGGLLYLRNLDLPTVFRLSCDRDAMIRKLKGHISPRLYRYIPSIQSNLNPKLVHAALFFYWIMGLFRRKPPRREKSFEETCLLRPGIHKGSFLYEEAALNTSDCRFTFDWLTFTPSTHSVALNYCSATGEYSRTDQWWRLVLKDTLSGRETSIRAKLVVNCAGVWTDQVNDQFGIETPFKHVLSKGVYIGVKRPAGHNSLMIFEMGDH
jgi:Glycerol-3-phosphate dehydrogenase